MGTKILLVEDNAVNAEMLVRRLVRRGFIVSLAVTGEEALQAVQLDTPDLILMDMNLPEIDGWEATRRLKADPATAGIAVIALTAHAMVSDREKCLAAGCQDYETKPIELERLLEKMHSLLRSAKQP